MSSLRQFAFTALRDVGNASVGEWEEWTGYAYHVRRRLTPEEARPIGEPIDVRGTPEAARRLARVAKYAMLSPQGAAVLQQELGVHV